jgi:hypothetical protein
MQQPPGLGRYSGSEQWRKALDVATELKATADALQLSPEQEWLRYVLGEAAEAIRGSVLWAATSSPVPPAVGADYLRQYVVAADATRGDAVVAAYFLSFAHGEGAVDDATYGRLEPALDAIESEMSAISRELTGRLGFDPYQERTPAS